MAQKQIIADQNTYLVVPFEEKDKAVKAAGKLPDGSNAITFDGENELWYAKPGTDLSKVSQWAPDPSKSRTTSTENDPQVEFAQTLEDAGFILDGLPQMDGNRYRVKTQDDKRGQRSGVYVGYLDGIPAGWYQDHRIHEKPVKWKAMGQKLDRETRFHIRAQALQRKIERQAEQKRSYDHNARRAEQVYALMPAATQNQGYLRNKGVKPFPGTKIDKRGRLVLPLKNENNEVRTLQRINSTGFKLLKKNGQKTGNYFVVGTQELKNGDPILYAEGYSTSASIAEATGRPVVMTVDAGNLPLVAEKLRNKYPDSPHVVLGDNDRGNKTNKGHEKAEEAAAITGGVFSVPNFNEKEKEEGLTDYNDLHQSRGISEVRYQVEQTIAQAQLNFEQVKKMNEPVISEKFERHIAKGLEQEQTNQNYEDDNNVRKLQQSSRRQSLKDMLIDKEEEARLINRDSESINQASAEQEGDIKSSIEPHIERKQEGEADNDALKWLQSGSRQPLKDILPPAAEQEGDIENSIEPHIERKQEGEADKDALKWLRSGSRQSAQSIQEKERLQEQPKRNPQSLDSFQFVPSAQQDDPFTDHQEQKEKTTFKPVIPDKVAKSYVEVEGKYYFASRPDSLAFVDKGARLQTKLSNAQVASSMVDIAESRGWTEIQVKGTQDFRREAWLEASSRGLEVRGYKPREEDLARLKKLTNERQPNEIEAREQADNPRTNPNQEPVGQPRQKSPVNRLAGKVVEHGKAPYEHNEDNRESYYVTLENSDGEKSTTWGVDLERAMTESGVKEGDTVELENQGRQPVTVNRPVKNEQGQVVRTEQINTHRNKWDVKAEALQDRERNAKDLVKEHPDLVNEVAAIKVAEKFSQQKFSSETDRERFMSKVRSQVATNVSKGEKTPEVKMRGVQEADNER